MSVRSLLIVAMCVLISAGCRRDPRLQVYIDNMNAEKRMLEDTLYDLQYDYECKQREVEKLQAELNRMKGTGAIQEPAKSGASRVKSPATPGDRLFPNIPDLEPPTVEQGTPDTKSSAPKSEQQRPKPPAQQKEDVDDLEPPTLELPSDAGEGAKSPAPDNNQKPADPAPGGAATEKSGAAPKVTQLYVDPARTGGEQTDDEPGDDGIVVCLQPRDSQGHFVAAPAPVTVVLLDADKLTQVSEWKLAADQLQAEMNTSSDHREMLLHLPWQGSPPPHDRLKVVVRYQLAAGKTLEQTQDISIKLRGKLAERWTPRAARRPDPPKSSARVADAPRGGNVADTGARANGTLSDSPAAPPASEVDGARQAQRPTWRPYR